MPFGTVARSFRNCSLEGAHQLSQDDPTAANTKEAPDRVAPARLGGVEVAGRRVSATLPPASWSVIRLRAAG